MKLFLATLYIIVKNWEQGKLYFTFAVSDSLAQACFEAIS